MIIRYRLNTGGQVITFGNECLKNWQEISYAIKRSDYGGVVRSFSGTFQFTGEAYRLIVGAYMSEYLSAYTTISVYTLNENQSYSLLYKARLDYGTMRMSDNVVELNSFDDTIASLIKAKKSTKYEYRISELAESDELNYDGMDIKNRVDFVCGGLATEMPGITIIDKYSITSGGHVLPMYYTYTDYMVKRSIKYADVEEMEKAWTDENVPLGTYFIRCESDATVHLYMKFNMQASVEMLSGNHVVKIVRKSANGTATIVTEQSNTFNEATTLGRALSFHFDGDIPMKAGDELYTVIGVAGTYSEAVLSIVISYFSCSVTWFDRILPVTMSVIKPVKLLRRLLTSINETDAEITGEIDSEGDDRLNNTMILPSESARLLSDGKLSTSFSDFSKWMESVFGYVYRIDGNTVRFVRRESLFDNSTVVDIEDGVNEVDMSVNDSCIYSMVKVGYSKEDYDTENGKDEFHWEEEYDTGINIKESTLELMSPYRADAYGIEFLAEGESPSKTTELFFVGVNYSDGRYNLDRSVNVQGVVSPSTMFNVMFSPRSFIEANKSYIAVCCDSLKFASSTGNSDVIINGTRETALFPLGERLFTAAVLNFDTFSAIDHKDDCLIKVKKNGMTYTGYMNEKTCKYGQYEGTKYELLIKSIEQ